MMGVGNVVIFFTTMLEPADFFVFAFGGSWADLAPPLEGFFALELELGPTSLFVLALGGPCAGLAATLVGFFALGPEGARGGMAKLIACRRTEYSEII